jgi:hypothetical protein
MFIPCIIRRIRKDQQFALICNTPLFYVLAPTCFGSSLSSSGEILRSFRVTWYTNRVGGISYNVWLRGLCAGLSWCRLLCFPAECILLILFNTYDIMFSGHKTPSHPGLKNRGAKLATHVLRLRICRTIISIPPIRLHCVLANKKTGTPSPFTLWVCDVPCDPIKSLAVTSVVA